MCRRGHKKKLHASGASGAAAAGGPDGGNGHGVMRVKQCHVYHP